MALYRRRAGASQISKREDRSMTPESIVLAVLIVVIASVIGGACFVAYDYFHDITDDLDVYQDSDNWGAK
jgi:hypothetical protein